MNTDFTGANGGNGDDKAPSSNSDKLRKSSRVESRAGHQAPEKSQAPNPKTEQNSKPKSQEAERRIELADRKIWDRKMGEEEAG